MSHKHNQNEVELEHLGATYEGKNPENFVFCTGI